MVLLFDSPSKPPRDHFTLTIFYYVAFVASIRLIVPQYPVQTVIV